MRLPNNSLGISDAIQFQQCPRLFHRNMLRWTQGEKPIVISGELGVPLAYGNALHESALEVVTNPDIYLDDAVDAGWKKWAHSLEPEHHEELKADVARIIQRTLEAPNLKLIAAEENMSVPLFLGESDSDIQKLDEEGVWYSYRFQIDALYQDRDDPSHYIIRDFKSYRQKKYQSDVDEDRQFTMYSWGVRQMIGDACQKVTIWVDQCKHEEGEIFSQRFPEDEQKAVEWLTSTFRAILDTPEHEIAETPTLNKYCAWCPLLMDCSVLEHASDYALSTISHLNDDLHQDLSQLPFEEYVKHREVAKMSLKALEEYVKRVDATLKRKPGVYGKREYIVNTIEKPYYPAQDVLEVVGPDALRRVKLSKKDVEPYFEHFSDELKEIKVDSGYERLTSKKANTKDK